MRVAYPLEILVHICRYGPCLSPERAAFGLSGLTLTLTLQSQGGSQYQPASLRQGFIK